MARANARAQDKERKSSPGVKGKGGEGKQGERGGEARGDGLGLRGSGGSGSGAGEEPNVEGLSVQLSRRTAAPPRCWSHPADGEGGGPRLGCDDRRPLGVSEFPNLEDAAAAQVVSLKVDPEAAARAEALASLAGIAAVAEEGQGWIRGPKRRNLRRRRLWRQSRRCRRNRRRTSRRALRHSRDAPNPRRRRRRRRLLLLPACRCRRTSSREWRVCPSPDGTRRSNSRGSAGGILSPPSGRGPAVRAAGRGAAATAATAAASAAGPAGSSAAAAEFVSKFYSVLQSAVEHQQQTFMRMGASATCAERRAEATRGT